MYNCFHYNAVLKEKSVTLAKNSSEVIDWIDKYIKNPSINHEERKKTVDKLCYKIDGQSASRITEAILSNLN